MPCCGRYSETRAPASSGKNFPCEKVLLHERALMEPIRKLADVVIGTDAIQRS